MHITVTYKDEKMYWVDKLCVENTKYKRKGIIDLSFDDPCDIEIKHYPKTNKVSVTYLYPKEIDMYGTHEDWDSLLTEEFGGKCYLPEEYNKEEYGKIDAKVTFKLFPSYSFKPRTKTFHVKNNQ